MLAPPRIRLHLCCHTWKAVVMLENQGEDRISRTTGLYHSQSLVSAHRHPTPSCHADQPKRSSRARVSHLVLKKEPSRSKTVIFHPVRGVEKKLATRRECSAESPSTFRTPSLTRITAAQTTNKIAATITTKQTTVKSSKRQYI